MMRTKTLNLCIMKNKIVACLIFALLPLGVQAQEATTKTFWDDPVNHPMTPFYLVIALVAIVTILILVVAIMLLNVLNMFVRKAAEERAAKLGIPYVPEPSWWQKLDRKLTDAVPLEKEETVLLDHNYDGIKELDNHLPPWWKWLFYGTIGWSAVYLVVYHITDSMPLSDQEYQNEVAVASEKLNKLRASQPVAAIDEAGLTYTADEALILKGKSIYISNCASCHKNAGEGGIGPNLTDEFWIHGGGIKNIYATVKNGVPEKGMISWKPILKPEEMRDVAYYILSIQGTNPPNAKAPQGTIWKEEKAAPADSTQAVKPATASL
jgi:cytochrome c oxidase cbb3-type subunit 3